MTAVYAFTRSDGSAAIGADDLALPSRTRAEKIVFFQGRFAVAMIGLDAVQYIISNIYEQQLWGLVPVFPDVQELSVFVYETLAALGKLRAAVEIERAKSERGVEHGEKVRTATAQLGVLDFAENELWDVELGAPYDMDRQDTAPVVVPRPRDAVIRFGIARAVEVARRGPDGAVGDLDLKKAERPKAYFQELLEADLLFLFRQGKHDALGTLGSVVSRRTAGGDLVFSSPFTSLLDILQEMHKRTP